jgi:hypothetical protein
MSAKANPNRGWLPPIYCAGSRGTEDDMAITVYTNVG